MRSTAAGSRGLPAKGKQNNAKVGECGVLRLAPVDYRQKENRTMPSQKLNNRMHNDGFLLTVGKTGKQCKRLSGEIYENLGILERCRGTSSDSVDAVNETVDEEIWGYKP
ncbi:hypothetical protein NDU88_007797 [Pleurodeles waltl]|uniref:Uncharacterized protein n=1 Tax=Pleurodeles waltl TaxID=8319 RepID=A0AAV7NXK2_PLEWA|nr:hypothetical protein NDU88_007797 [Pleurodeles waltl]